MKYTLVGDGSSDRALLPILTWSLKRHTTQPVEEQWVDFGRIPRQKSTESKFRAALDLYPCDILFVHRDAENQPPEWRRIEIEKALTPISIKYVPVVPVRMTESWLLFDEPSIRAAAGNPKGAEELNLPKLDIIENIPDPKATLFKALTLASGLGARRRSRFAVQERVHLISHYVNEYSALEALTAFRILQQDIRAALDIN